MVDSTAMGQDAIETSLLTLRRAVEDGVALYDLCLTDEVTSRAAFGVAVSLIQRIGDVNLRTAVFLFEAELSRAGR